MSHDDDMLEEAIAALSSATQAMEQRLKELQSRLDEIRQQRAHFYRSEAERMLPGFSMRVLAELEREVPVFVTAFVRTTFSQHRKMLGLFKPAGYDSALTMIQTRLAGFIEQTRCNEFARHDLEIAALEEERDRLELRLHETTQNLMAMTAALDRKRTFSPAVRSELARIVERSRFSASGSSPNVSGRNSRISDRRSSDWDSGTSSGDDMWYYTATDIPSLFRTWILDSTSQGAGSDTGECNHDQHVPNGSSDNAASTQIDTDSDMSAMAACAGLQEIATDDRLGAFS